MIDTTKINEGYKNLVREQFQEAINYFRKGNTEFDVHLEHFRNSDKPIDITLVFLSGQIQQDVIQYPVQILVECDNNLEKLCGDSLSYMATRWNSQIVKIGPNLDQYRVFYNMPTMTEKFKNTGIYVRSTYTMESTLFTFNEVLDLKRITLETTYNNQLLTEEINYLNFGLSYLCDTNSSGSIESPKVYNTGETCMSTYTISYVPKMKKERVTLSNFIRKLMCSNEKANQEFTLKIEFDDGFDDEVEVKCIIQQATYTKDYGGWPVYQMSLIRTIEEIELLEALEEE